MAERERRAHRQRHAWPQVNRLYEDRRGAVVPADVIAISEGFRSYHVQSRTVAAWRQLYEQMGWVWPGIQARNEREAA